MINQIKALIHKREQFLAEQKVLLEKDLIKNQPKAKLLSMSEVLQSMNTMEPNIKP